MIILAARLMKIEMEWLIRHDFDPFVPFNPPRLGTKRSHWPRHVVRRQLERALIDAVKTEAHRTATRFCEDVTDWYFQIHDEIASAWWAQLGEAA